MSVPVKTSLAPSHGGLVRSALLMRALGAKASSVWSQLSPQEADKLSRAMQTLPEDLDGEQQAVADYIELMSAPAPNAPPLSTDIWGRLSAVSGGQLAQLLQRESPQVIALTLSRLSADIAASTVQSLPRALATEALKRMLNLGDVHPAALQIIASSLEMRLARTQSDDVTNGHERVAQIFDHLDQGPDNPLLASLEQADPGAGEKIRALMFTFDDLAALDPASLQTILGQVDRAVLTVALKGAAPHISDAFFKNITQRAAELLRDDIEEIGPVRRSEIDAARSEILSVARALLKRGDLLPTDPDDELIE